MAEGMLVCEYKENEKESKRAAQVNSIIKQAECLELLSFFLMVSPLLGCLSACVEIKVISLCLYGAGLWINSHCSNSEASGCFTRANVNHCEPELIHCEPEQSFYSVCKVLDTIRLSTVKIRDIAVE